MLTATPSRELRTTRPLITSFNGHVSSNKTGHRTLIWISEPTEKPSEAANKMPPLLKLIVVLLPFLTT
jgi:hypothetical protein